MINDWMVNIQKTMENHHFLWENSLFLWPFSIANCLFTRGYMYAYIYIYMVGGAITILKNMSQCEG